MFTQPKKLPVGVTWSIAIGHPEPKEGKSTLSWILANSLALLGYRVGLLDGDVINPKNDDPTVSGFVNPQIPLPFAVFNPETWQEEYISELDIRLVDGSRDPGEGLQTFIQTECNGVIVPFRTGRGYKKGVAYARSIDRAGLPLLLVLNGFAGEQTMKFGGLCDAWGATKIQLPEMTGANELTSAGRLPQYDDRYADIVKTGEAFAGAVEHWIESSIVPQREAA